MDSGQIILFQTQGGDTKIEVRLANEFVWLTATDGKTYTVSYYNLDMIISLGYRVNSLRGVQFRQWATRVLKDYMIKGFALNDNLLKRIANFYLNFAELQAKSHVPTYMKDWIKKLDDFLTLSGKELLTHAGSMSVEVAKLKADTQYEKFRERTQYQLSQVEIHFIEAVEAEQEKLRGKQ